jgi:alkaline phosphatase D
MSLLSFSWQPTRIALRNLILMTMLIVLSALATHATASQLQAGPMVGATAMRQVKVWVQATGKGQAQLEYWEMGAAKVTPVRLKSAMVPLNEETDFIAQFTVGLLEPGRTYGYRVMINGKEQKVPQQLVFKTQALWQWRTEPPEWKLAFGSCVFNNDATVDRPGRPYGGAVEVFDQIAKQKPDVMLWMGDYLYHRESDEDSEMGLAYRWRFDRRIAAIQPLLRTGSHLAIWDDHEYGPNDSNSSYRFKGESLKLFKRYWANATYGLPETPGIFGNHRFNDAEIFMLDNRYHRDNDKLQTKDKTKLGAEQLRWLKNALLASYAPVKLIAVGGQTTNEVNRFEGWHNFPEERADFLKFLVDHKINGVILLSGDRHFTELLKTDRPGSYPLYELTCSPISSGAVSSLDAAERSNKALVEGTLVNQRNFCTLDFSGSKAERKITMRSFSNTGEQLWERELKLSELQTPTAAKP